MSQTTADAFLELVSSRRGHFEFESGYHGELWLDLDPLFARPSRVAPLIAGLAAALRCHDVEGVCGPLVGGAFLAQSLAAALDLEFLYTEPVPSPAGSGLYQARYRLPAALSPRVRAKRIAIVDDVISAGSSSRATWAELQTHRAHPVAVGTLLLLGSAGADFFRRNGLAVEAVSCLPFELWTPASCPLCAGGVPLERPLAGDRAIESRP
jgi:orotate phosphoribosyltransferase